MKPNFVFFHIHIPKCGGTTFINILKENFNAKKEFYRESPLFMYRHSSKVVELAIKRAPYIHAISSHHISLDLPYHLKDPVVKAICYLRNPIERFVSHFYYEKKRSKIKNVMVFDDSISKMSIEEYIDHLLGLPASKNHIQDQFSWLTRGTAYKSIDMIKQLLDAEKLLLFRLSDFSESCVILEKMFPDQFRECSYIKKNEGNYRNDLSNSLIENIKALTPNEDFILQDLATYSLDYLKNKNFNGNEEFAISLKRFNEKCLKKSSESLSVE